MIHILFMKINLLLSGSWPKIGWASIFSQAMVKARRNLRNYSIIQWPVKTLNQSINKWNKLARESQVKYSDASKIIHFMAFSALLTSVSNIEAKIKLCKYLVWKLLWKPQKWNFVSEHKICSGGGGKREKVVKSCCWLFNVMAVYSRCWCFIIYLFVFWQQKTQTF